MAQDTPPPKKRPGDEVPVGERTRGRKPNPERAQMRAAEAAIAIAKAQEAAGGVEIDRAAKCDAIADSLLAALESGEFTLSSAVDAARVIKILSEVARLDRGQATQIVGTTPPATPEGRLARFHELTAGVIDVGSIEHKPMRAVG